MPVRIAPLVPRIETFASANRNAPKFIGTAASAPRHRLSYLRHKLLIPASRKHSQFAEPDTLSEPPSYSSIMTVLPTDTPKHPFAVLHVPHASVTIPTADRASIHLSDDELALELRRMTDRYTDELFDLDPAIASAVSFPISRLVVDPERFLDDAFEPMAARGMGVLYTTTSHGAVLRTPPVRAERQRLIDQYYAPHHDLLTTTVDAAVHAWHSCLVIDCHSFPAAALPYELDQTGERAEICLGTDSFHTPQALIDSARNIFEEAGFTVCVDRPFSGALVPAAHYGRDPRVMAIMVEVNRGIYMDEQTGERLPGFSEIRARVQAAVRGVIDECAGSL